MKRGFNLSILFVGLIALNGCKKDTIGIPFDDVFYKPYATGIIKFQYQIPTIVFGNSTIKDTTVNFTSIGDNLSEKDDYGYSKPSTPWVQLHRLNPKDFQNRIFIFFVGTNLNSLTLPYKFKAGDIQNAQINYVIGLRPFYDTNGNLVYGTNTYAATTYLDNFELTVLSRVNNRLQGIFSGLIKNQDGLIINIKKGLFDIEIVDK
ncbi:MAG: hypothetical protein JWO92_2114 [Chitinophagaceae bacterium]|nr:hypothetical protein [Chitinophagaceae bacterium]